MKKKGILLGLAVVLVLAAAFWWGGDAPGLQGLAVDEPAPTPVTASVAPTLAATPAQTPAAPVETPLPTSTPQVTDTPAATTAPEQKETPALPAPADTPAPSAAVPAPTPTPTPVPEEGQSPTCTITVRCDTLLANLDWLPEEKRGLVPESGVLLAETTMSFTDGESVFDVLRRVTREQKIHLEFVETPALGSMYIEGMGNLYEFDCGERSGWLYSVNGEFPGYGCSSYTLKDGDRIEWRYSCDGGSDVGNSRIS